MLNHIVVSGRLTRDPELRQTGNGVNVANFSLAVERDFKNQSGERDVDFIDIVAWRGTAEFVSNYFSKGRTAIVSGRLQMRNWQDNDGNKRVSAEVVAENVYFGDSKKDDSGQNYQQPAGYQAPQNYQAQPQNYAQPAPQQVPPPPQQPAYQQQAVPGFAAQPGLPDDLPF